MTMIKKSGLKKLTKKAKTYKDDREVWVRKEYERLWPCSKNIN